ncbi:uncharacterized protein J4E78_003319 [Alternaria triticimaculans]|uniref:uncharacterized protein n=1 Tax=Alternaria triticimaculans TaxID=297637 RepID=UPI0020C526D0|nr:uncharacterized protein J4E78_003319 [Alternaria triticimaculans]KAI4665854.1 hypothetical protein J4E78_003319 [Alternaria triticimaculans]
MNHTSRQHKFSAVFSFHNYENMPALEDIIYSREACIAAVRDYYQFLTRMYMDESVIIEPPKEGWPSVTPDSMRGLNKTDEVISLLQHLPYIRGSGSSFENPQAAPWCAFSDWQRDLGRVLQGGVKGETLKLCSEGASFTDEVPAHVIGLTTGGRDNADFLLDTELGVVYWIECPYEIRHNSSREPIEDDPYDYAPDNEAQWRAESECWAIADFFGMLKDQFRQLSFIPIGPKSVIDIYATLGPEDNGLVTMLQKVYREHGWPDVTRYRKTECLAAVQAALKEHYPHFAQ